jgi:hypothetical protein
MKAVRFLLVLAVLGLSSSVVLADSTDPRMKLQQAAGSTGLFSPNDANFSFDVHGGTSPQEFDFINATGLTATAVDLLITPFSNNTVTLAFACAAPNVYFLNCSPTTPQTGQTLITFFNPNDGPGGFGGIPFATDLTSPDQCDGIENCSTTTPGADFGVVAEDLPGTSDLTNLPADQGFHVQGRLIVPEPSAIFLALAGGALLALLKRR